MSKFLRHESCPECQSSDGLAVYDDNNHCFVCGYHISTTNEEIKITKTSSSLTPLPTKTSAITKRKIDEDTAMTYKVSVNTNSEGHIDHVYPYFDEEGSHVANKIRRRGEKAFYWEGDVERAGLFGQPLFRRGGKAITIVEGECDAMAGFQLTGSKYPCVSVKSSTAAKSDCAKNFEYLESFERIVICFDNDEPGKKAANEVAQLFTPGKACILTLERAKDANDYLMQGLIKEYISEWWKAPVYTPEGLQFGSDPALYEEIVNYREPHSIPYPWQGLNKSTYGLRLGEFTLFTADTGIGKTTFMKEIEYCILQNEELKARNYGVGFLHLEEPKRETALGLMSIHDNKPYHLPDTPKSEHDLRKAYDEVVNTTRVIIYDHFGSTSIDVILNKVRHLAALGCKYQVLDHLSIIVSDQSGDERKQLDEISTKLKTLTMNLNICLICVIHVNRQGGVRGSAGPEQVSNNVIRLERDKKDPNEWRRNVTRISVEKCRLSGRTGPVSWVYYNSETGRLVELDREQTEAYERGGNPTGNEFDFS